MKSVFKSLIILILLASGCKNDKGSMSNFNSMNLKISEKDLVKLSGKKIYFGHQSVGYNIVYGINLLVNESQLKYKVVEELPDTNSSPGFYHTLNGKNGDPGFKIDDFVSKMENGVGKYVDVALFKFCYVDFTKETDVKLLFDHYKNSMAKLKAEFPATKFVYCTVPVACNKGGIKTFLKQILGRNNGKVENIKRNQFNQLVHDEYDNKEPVFDIAKFESYENSCFFIEDSEKIYTLYPAYTSDGGHLNTIGSKIVAKGLLDLLVNLN
jgi:hypothetical protein